MENFGVTVLCSAFNLRLLSWAGSLRSLSSAPLFLILEPAILLQETVLGLWDGVSSFPLPHSGLRPCSMESFYHKMVFRGMAPNKDRFSPDEFCQFWNQPFYAKHTYICWCLFDEPVDGAMCTLGLAWKQTFRKHVQPTWYFCQWDEAKQSWREELESSNLHSNACV